MQLKTICGDLSMTGKHYVITGRLNWADEFDVHFFELLNEDMYNKYMAAKEIFGSFEGCYGFGSNEWFDEFDFLGFEPKEITQEQYEFLQSLGLSGETVVLESFYKIEEERDDNDLEYVDLCYGISLDEFKNACLELHEKMDNNCNV